MQDLKQRVEEATRPGGVNQINAKRVGELIQIIIELTEREEKLVGVMKLILEPALNSKSCIYCGCDETHKIICPASIIGVTLKELGIE